MGTEDPIVIVTSNIVKTFDEGKKSWNIFRSKESIRYFTTLNKLENVGIRNIALDLFPLYFTNRY